MRTLILVACALLLPRLAVAACGDLDDEHAPTIARMLAEATTGLPPGGAPWDFHVHVAGAQSRAKEPASVPPGATWYSPKAFAPLRHPIRTRKRVALMAAAGIDSREDIDADFGACLARRVSAFPPGSRFGLLALDWPRGRSGSIVADPHFFTPDARVRALSKALEGRAFPVVSIHPRAPDALKRLAAAHAAGVRFVKWIPSAQRIDPMSAPARALLEAMLAREMVLLSHGGEERAVWSARERDQHLGNPQRLRPALEMGLKVVVLHAASLGETKDLDTGATRTHLDLFLEMLEVPEYEGLLFGELSAVTFKSRVKRGPKKRRSALNAVLAAMPRHHHRFVNGSDYPLPGVHVRGVAKLVSINKLVREGHLAVTAAEKKALKHLRRANPLLFDYILKRRLTSSDGRHRFPASVFAYNPCLEPGQRCRGPAPRLPASPTRPLRIDVHAHVFNAEDLPLDAFVRNIVFKDHPDARRRTGWLVGWISRMLIWAGDSASQEHRQLDARLAAGKHPIPAPDVAEDEDFAREVETVASEKGAGLVSAFGAPKRYLGWLRRLTAPRAANVRRLLKLYGDDVDLFVTSLIDMDYWVGKPYSKTSRDDQALLLSKLSILNDGRLLPFAAYDPWRDIATEGDHLKQVQRAVREWGFVGVKLYTVLGFRALGNAGQSFACWANRGPRAGRPDFGAKLDEHLRAFYGWAQERGVPVLTHVSTTNESCAAAGEAAAPRFWRDALTEFPRLRVNLGHFGGMAAVLDPDSRTGPWMPDLIDLLEHAPHAYADLSNFDVAPRQLDRYLAALALATRLRPHLARRLMYGSDWFMQAARPTQKRQFTAMRDGLNRWLEGRAARRISGENAICFLGLRATEPARERLDDFYEKHGVEAGWRDRLDAATVVCPGDAS